MGRLIRGPSSPRHPGNAHPAWVDRQPAGGVQRSSLPGPSPCTACRGQSREHQPPSSGPSSAIRSQPFPTVALGVIGPAMPGCRVVPSPQVRCHEKRRRLFNTVQGLGPRARELLMRRTKPDLDRTPPWGSSETGLSARRDRAIDGRLIEECGLTVHMCPARSHGRQDIDATATLIAAWSACGWPCWRRCRRWSRR